MISTLRKTFFAVLATLAVVAAPVVAPMAVYAETANINDNLKAGSNLDPTGQNTDISSGSTGVTNLITSIVNIFSLIVGMVSVVMIIYGGFRYITSGGDSGKVTGAKNTIIYAVIGLVIVVLAQVIVKFILDKATTIQ